MTFKRITMWIIECDKCKKKYSAGENEYECYEKLKEAKEYIDDAEYDNWKRKGNKLLCEDCQ